MTAGVGERVTVTQRWWHLLLVLGVTIAGAIPRAARIAAQDGFSWDESYYVPAARGYLHGDFTNNFEHPPLGKWAIAAGIRLVGDRPLGWRLAALVAGILTIPLTWLLARRLFGSVWWATFAAFLVATDGLLIVQSRTALLDSLLPPLVVGAALCIVLHVDRRDERPFSPWLIGAGVLLGAAMAVKWEAGGALVGVLVGFVVIGRHDRRKVGAALVAFLAVPVVVYMASYAGHFQHGLSFTDFFRLQNNMLRYHQNFRLDHPSDSSPLTWLWLQRPVAYGSLNSSDRISIHMALGNPALWWSFVASLPLLLVVWWRERDRTVEVVLFAWLVLHLVWLVVLRPGFIYYLTPLVPFMAIGVTWSVRWVALRWRVGRPLPIVVAAAVLVAFLLYLPVWTYHDMSLRRFHSLMLFDGWEP
ncbi:MAG: dolichyl-phosphate-mannose-protein mannosyltransferase [Acidimicrobiaceae bacterium]